MVEMKKVVLVTGAGRGIGRGIAERLVAAGYGVVIADIDGEAAGKVAEELGAAGTALPLAVDVADEAAVAGMIGTVMARFGRLDALVNNAGIAAPHRGPVEQLALDDWNRLIGTNLTGVFLCCKHAIPHLRHSNGAIVNIASTRALQSEPHTEAYAASKGGVVALTHALAVSLGPAIRVNCISPGWIDVTEGKGKLTPEDHAQHPAGRVGRPEDIAEMALFLISRGAGFVTGQNFVVDGGMTRRMIYVE